MSTPFMRLCTALAFALLVSACTSEVKDIPASTQVTLRIDAAQSVASRIERLHFSLWVKAADGWHAGTSTDFAVRAEDFPLDVPILPRDGKDSDAQVEVVIQAFGGGFPVLRTRVVSQFQARQLIVISTSLVLCPTPNLGCDGEVCHGEDCTACTASGVCVPVGVTEPDTQIDLTVPDAAGPSDTGRVSTDGGAAQGTDAQRLDATAPAQPEPTVDGGGIVEATSDASTEIADTGAPTKPAPTAECPAQNVCTALSYPCLPTPAGYTCQGQRADWHMPDGVPGAKFAQSYTGSAETVVDNVTKLEWQTGLPAAYTGCTRRRMMANGIQGTYAELCSREEAASYCAQLSRGGHDDWRLPSMIELVSLLDMGPNTNSALSVNVNYFGDSGWQDFLSSSTGTVGTSSAWSVNYDDRVVVLNANATARVRCVRGGSVPDFATPSERYLVASDTVTDRATSLVWQRGFSAALVGEGAAETYCAGLGNGYRVPSGNELLTLVDPTRENPAIDIAAFPNTPSDDFATSDKLVIDTAVNFESGMLLRGTASTARARCVKNQ